MAYFDFSGTVSVSIQYKNSPIRTVQIRPYSYGIIPVVRDNTIRFTLSEPHNLVIQVNENLFGCLHLFGNPVETDVPGPDDPNVLYYGAGFHNVIGGVLNVPSGKTVYLAGGAALSGGVNFTNSSNATLRSRGVVYAPSTGIAVISANNITIDGITAINANINAA